MCCVACIGLKLKDEISIFHVATSCLFHCIDSMGTGKCEFGSASTEKCEKKNAVKSVRNPNVLEMPKWTRTTKCSMIWQAGPLGL